MGQMVDRSVIHLSSSCLLFVIQPFLHSCHLCLPLYLTIAYSCMLLIMSVSHVKIQLEAPASQ
jgi:hypothetical protein